MTRMAGPLVSPLRPDFGAVIDGVDLRRASPDDIACVDDALRRARLVVIPGQDLDEAAQLSLASRLGCLVAAELRHRFDRRMVPDVIYERESAGGARSKASYYNEQWHADRSWALEPAPVTMLYAVDTQPGCAATEFADMVSAYESLPESTRSMLDSCVGLHYPARSRPRRHGPEAGVWHAVQQAMDRAKVLAERRRDGSFDCRPATRVGDPGARHPVVQTHRWSGRRYVHLGDHVWTLEGYDDVSGPALVDDLNRTFVAGATIYRHAWTTGDLVLFDNPAVLHRREPGGDENATRVLRRCMVWRTDE